MRLTVCPTGPLVAPGSLDLLGIDTDSPTRRARYCSTARETTSIGVPRFPRVVRVMSSWSVRHARHRRKNSFVEIAHPVNSRRSG